MKLLAGVVCGAVCVLFLVNANMATASELVYTPINPSFGGNPLHGQWLLNLAQEQSKFKEEIADWREITLDTFEEMITSQILYRIARDIVLEAFGEDILEVGHYEIGNFAIDITTDGDLITVVMSDVVTGDITVIEVPYYGS